MMRLIVLLWRLLGGWCLLVKGSESFSASASHTDSSLSTLRAKARSFLDQKDADSALSVLSDMYALDPQARGLNQLFESALRLRLSSASSGVGNEKESALQDRFGLASLLLDQERYEEAQVYLREIIHQDPSHERAISLLFRADAACCYWDDYSQDVQSLRTSLRIQERMNASGSKAYLDVPAVHPFEALKWPCISLMESTQIATLYARRAIRLVDADDDEPQSTETPKVVTVSNETHGVTLAVPNTNNMIRLGYISPDFTDKHPLAFLMQDVFRHHNRDDFSVHLYSLASPETATKDDGPELLNIRNGAEHFTSLSVGKNPMEMASIIQKDEIDILIDLCGHTGTMRMAQLMALRPAPVQISYMGFPGSSGGGYHDYMVCDKTVVPPHLRGAYAERLIWMPHSYFVNSHASSCVEHCGGNDNHEEQAQLRQQYGLPVNGFVFCCHSRPDKIDPIIFRVWMRALKQTREQTHDAAVLWLLRSGAEMERNLRRLAQDEFKLDDGALVFADVCPRNEHLKRLCAADLFLDTPAYNAHTLGCDTLFAGVPMISLLAEGRTVRESSHDLVPTEKLASRVGASLLLAAGLDEMICVDLNGYETLMVQCATDRRDWFEGTIRHRLRDRRLTLPLFDTKRWVQNLQLALRSIVLSSAEERRSDIDVVDDYEV